MLISPFALVEIAQLVKVSLKSIGTKQCNYIVIEERKKCWKYLGVTLSVMGYDSWISIYDKRMGYEEIRVFQFSSLKVKVWTLILCVMVISNKINIVFIAL